MLLFSPRITRRGLAVCMVVAAGVGAATAGDPAGPRTADVTFELVALPAPSGGDATATLLDIEPRLRKVRGHQHLPRLRAALEAHAKDASERVA